MGGDPKLCPFCDGDVVEKPHVCPGAGEIVLSPEAFEELLEIINKPTGEAMKELLKK